MSFDVINEILSSLSDFNTLSAAIRVSKSFYEVFQAHPQSIAHDVVANIVGPALPQAARLAHYLCQSYNGESRPSMLLDEGHFHGRRWSLTRRMAEYIQEYAQSVAVLEDFFSIRYKDRTSRTSVLDAKEALRFERAAYRYMSCYEFIAHDGFFQPDDEMDTEDENEETDGDEDEDDDEDKEQRKIHAGLRKQLEDLPSEELFELLENSGFAQETNRWHLRTCRMQVGYQHYPVDNLPIDLKGLGCHLAGRPTHKSFYYNYSGPEPITCAAQEILRSRKVPEERFSKRVTGTLVSTVFGDKDACSRCHEVKGVELFGPTNMFLLSGVLDIQDKVSLLPGLLPMNPTETRLIAYHIKDNTNKEPVSDETLVHEMMDMEPEGEDADNKHWSKNDWYCLLCLKHLFSQRFMLWWRDTKHKAGAPVQDDCWYGWNCRTMRHRPAHALKLNHLCKPTRGDPPAAGLANNQQAT